MSRVIEKLTVPQLVKKFAAFYGTRRFTTKPAYLVSTTYSTMYLIHTHKC